MERSTVAEGTDGLRTGQILSAEEAPDKSSYGPTAPPPRLRRFNFCDHLDSSDTLSRLNFETTKAEASPTSGNTSGLRTIGKEPPGSTLRDTASYRQKQLCAPSLRASAHFALSLLRRHPSHLLAHHLRASSPYSSTVSTSRYQHRLITNRGASSLTLHSAKTPLARSLKTQPTRTRRKLSARQRTRSVIKARKPIASPSLASRVVIVPRIVCRSRATTAGPF